MAISEAETATKPDFIERSLRFHAQDLTRLSKALTRWGYGVDLVGEVDTAALHAAKAADCIGAPNHSTPSRAPHFAA